MDINFNFNFPLPQEGGRVSLDDSDEPVVHPPIIIDGGSDSVKAEAISTSMKFGAEEYDPAAGENKFTSRGLFLHRITIVNNNNGDKHTCYTVPANVRCKIEVTSQRGGDTRTFIIIGANRATGGSPTVEFDFEEFKNVDAGDVRYEKYSGANFKITRLRIFKLEQDGVTWTPIQHPGTGNTDPCPLVPDNGACEITIFDLHVGG